MGKLTTLKYYFVFCFLFLLLYGCNEERSTSVKSKVNTSPYLNHSDTAHYVGMNTCRSCHQNIYNTFIETGMGKSFGLANKEKSSASFSGSGIYDRFSDYHYKAFWQGDSMYIKEFRLDKKDTSHSRTEHVSYIVGSGQHTNSHLQSSNGYLCQMPMTYYTQKKQWDLPPGFENGINTRFSRKIGLECMSCHNGYPEFVKGSENKYSKLPTGIDCERCHGPGSIHVAQRSTGSKVDTSQLIDYSIVNPAKLSIEAQFDICQRCHLQGNAVLKEGRSFFDFLPGQKLSDYISVFLPKYENADDEFIMASHADRLKQSACFIKSFEKNADTKALKPYKNALTCVTCHNPHVSVRKTNKDVFNEACLKCHGNSGNELTNKKTLNELHSSLKAGTWSNCVSCHMPLSGSTDIPHVTVHDHYIRKPISNKEIGKIKKFIGLYSINEKQPSVLTKALAYINQYEKFDQNKSYLDSAEFFLKTNNNLIQSSHALIQLYFIKGEYSKVLNTVSALNEKRCLDSLFTRQTYDNRDAWTAYRIGESYNYTANRTKALQWYKRAIDLAPYALDFRNKYASALASENKLEAAAEEFEFIIGQYPKMVSAYSNLGYIKLLQGLAAEALNLYTKGEKLDPDNEALLLNLAGYYLYAKQNTTAVKYLKRIIKINPTNQQAIAALKQLNT